MKNDIREIVEKMEEWTGKKVEIVGGKRHHRVRLILENTVQEFAIPTKEFAAGCAKNNFYSSMRRKINQRIEQIRARQIPSA
jgi:metal-dependent hydrolase (beta-lactamase superfamily II)